ncbi:MAG: ABC transporter permease [Myxococcota bacterium]
MTRSLVRMRLIAGNTFREATRSRLLYNLLFFALLMIASSISAAKINLGWNERIYRDFGLSAIALFGTLIAIFVGIGLVYREIAEKTVYTMLARPLHRWEFLLGKYAGLVAVLAVEVAVMAVCFLGMLALRSSPVTPGLVQAIAMIGVELALVTAVAIFFSSFTTPYLAGMCTVALWVIGHLLGDLRAFGQHSEAEIVQRATELLYWTLPNLDLLDFKSLAAEGRPIAASRVWLATGYAALYSTGLLIASVILFRRRDFR